MFERRGKMLRSKWILILLSFSPGAMAVTVDSIEPASGMMAGGTEITIAGTGIDASSTVLLGDVPCETQGLTEEGGLLCVTGAAPAAVVDVTVRTGEEEVVMPLAYTYRMEASFASINANIIQTRCAFCHFYNYDILLSGNIVPGEPESSPLYLSVKAGRMPLIPPALTAPELQAIYDWIAMGAKNNVTEIEEEPAEEL